MSETTITNLTNKSPAHFRREYAELCQQFQNVKDKQGAVGSLWDGVKSITGVGVSESKCSSMLEKFKNGEISFEQAANYIEKYDSKQTDTTDLIANIVTGVAAIATTTIAGIMGGPILPILALGAGTGAIFKTAFKFVDRATNGVQNDEYNAKLIAKDVISGAVTGAASAVPSGIAQGVKTGSRALAIKNGMKCGIACGAASGSINYIADAALGNREFNFGDLVKQTGTSAFISGTVGAGVGLGMYNIADANGLIGQEVVKSTAQKIASDGASSSARKVLANMEKNIIAA